MRVEAWVDDAARVVVALQHFGKLADRDMPVAFEADDANPDVDLADLRQVAEARADRALPPNRRRITPVLPKTTMI